MTGIIVPLFQPAELCSMKKRSRLNNEWHLAYRMPENPSLQQRIDWHLEHAKNCRCCEIPDKLKKEMKKIKMKISRS